MDKSKRDFIAKRTCDERKFSLHEPSDSRERIGKKRRRFARFEMTGSWIAVGRRWGGGIVRGASGE